MTGGAGEASAPPVETTSATPRLTPHSNLSTYRSTRTHSEIALPVRLRIPAIDVDFSRLDTLQRGDEILVDRADGTTARFVVTGLGNYRKGAFPSDLVYYPTLDPELRLVTCGGPISGQYSENLVVFAAQAS
jgi:hypothetical protein